MSGSGCSQQVEGFQSRIAGVHTNHSPALIDTRQLVRWSDSLNMSNTVFYDKDAGCITRRACMARTALGSADAQSQRNHVGSLVKPQTSTSWRDVLVTFGGVCFLDGAGWCLGVGSHNCGRKCRKLRKLIRRAACEAGLRGSSIPPQATIFASGEFRWSPTTPPFSMTWGLLCPARFVEERRCASALTEKM